GVSEHIDFLQDNQVVKQIEQNLAPKEEGPLPNEEQAEAAKLSKDKSYDPLLTGSEYEDVELKELLPDSKPVQPSPTPSFRYQPVTYEEVQYAINKPVRITMNDGAIIEGALINVEPDALMVESLASGGSVALSYEHENIKSVEVRLAEGEQLEIPSDQTLDTLTVEEDISLNSAPAVEQARQSSAEQLRETIDEVEVGTPEQVEALIEE
ncbi:MAG: hypothetical protein AAF372_03465, partial [Pseudomonadota bacterium]